MILDTPVDIQSKVWAMSVRRNTTIGVYALSRVDKSKVITDVPANGSINDHKKLSCALANVIKNSDPNFTIGIYGEWGTGKTTLMEMVEEELTENKETDSPKILSIWFSAWRYEREEQLATIAILKTIANEIAEYSKRGNGSGKNKNRWSAILEICSDVILHQMDTNMSVEKMMDYISKNTDSFIDVGKKVTTYFDELKKIQEAMEKIREKDKKCRIVVFVDDLDRCSPPKALQVLQSIKVFFDIPGFIYVLGISHEMLSRLIDHAYKELNVEGKEYIKKIIQVPVTLPSWEEDNLNELLGEICNEIKLEYRNKLIEQDTRTDIFDVADNNPRQLKRLINSFVVTSETYSGIESLDPSTLFRCLSIQKNRPKLFSELIKNKDFRESMIYFTDEMDKTLGHSRGSEGEAIAPHHLEIYNLVTDIYKNSSDEGVNDGEMKFKIRAAFISSVKSKYPLESNTSKKSKDSNPWGPQVSPEGQEAISALFRVLESGELVKMTMRDWHKLKGNLAKITKDKNLDKYKNAINMMKEDLKINTPAAET